MDAARPLVCLPRLTRHWRSSSSSRPSASIWASAPNTAARSVSDPVSTVSPPVTSGTRVGKAERAVGPNRPRIRIAYRPGGALLTQPRCSLTQLASDAGIW